tara:strand:- start:760 stop:894 length:135 start_codon:yes stop_codon:yes gene_type:complete
MKLEIIYTAADEIHVPQKPRSYGSLHISHDLFVAVDCSALQEWS